MSVLAACCASGRCESFWTSVRASSTDSLRWGADEHASRRAARAALRMRFFTLPPLGTSPLTRAGIGPLTLGFSLQRFDALPDLLHGVLSRTAVAACGREVCIHFGVFRVASRVGVLALLGRSFCATQLIVRTLQVRCGVALGIALVSLLNDAPCLDQLFRRLGLLGCAASGENAQQRPA